MSNVLFLFYAISQNLMGGTHTLMSREVASQISRTAVLGLKSCKSLYMIQNASSCYCLNKVALV